MIGLKRLFIGALMGVVAVPATAETLAGNNEILFQQLAKIHRLSAGEIAAVIGLILATRGLQVLIALAVSEERAVYISYLLLGAILVVGGSAAMRRRSGTH